jgi:biopolymer transport protein ExbB
MTNIESLKEIVDIATLLILGLMGFIALLLTLERFFVYRGFDIANYTHIKSLEIDLTKNLSVIATIASNAPYVGLLGTVGGIIITFYTLGESGLTESKEIMVGLALALKATALGLVVAIPSMVFYNLLVRKAEVLEMQWQVLQDEPKEDV